MSKVLILNGPNLNLLGKREPEIYGQTTLQDLQKTLSATAPINMQLEFFQSNHEGIMIDRIHNLLDDPLSGIVINPGAWTHTSIALRDALAAIKTPFVEVHISNVHGREAFRHHSYFSDLALAVIAGCGFAGYGFALETLHKHFKDS
ncbi:type II 3-dehydroquinate dehydratase [Litorivicinus sp.]|jgi:3-dehydroquinate dehydratase-2|nr:type II 3-dehydroquinate dehydratase [Litorivicinus sp.]MDC1240325.1 type II 3-dehydroquinate dehydratase [Litorivicinus sp.]|tara:strand:- start:21431 stop:21871 length:441 start_codon:yes stop_codon:yes gene_type:complete